MTELKQLIAMLDRAGIGYGIREDFGPDRTAVLVEAEGVEGVGSEQGPVTEFLFDGDGRLIDVYATR